MLRGGGGGGQGHNKCMSSPPTNKNVLSTIMVPHMVPYVVPYPTIYGTICAGSRWVRQVGSLNLTSIPLRKEVVRMVTMW